MPTHVSAVEFQNIGEGEDQQSQESQNLDFLEDVYLPVSIELGRTRMQIQDIISLNKGSLCLTLKLLTCFALYL